MLLALAALASANVLVIGPDYFDHLNNARWFLRGESLVKLIEHRPPAVTLLLAPVAVAYELLRLAPETALLLARLLSVLALAGAAWLTGAAAGRTSAGLLVASSPLLLALAPAGSHDVVAALGVAGALWSYRRLIAAPTTARLAACALALGVAACVRLDGGIALGGVLAAELLGRRWRRALALGAAAGGVALALLALQFGARHGLSGAVEGFFAMLRDASQAVARDYAPDGGRLRLYVAGWLRTLGLPALPLALWGAWTGLRRREPVVLAAGVVLLLGTLELVVVANAQVRYLAQLIPPAALLAARGLAAVAWGRRPAAALLLVAWPVCLGLSELWAFGDPAYREPVARRLSDACQARARQSGGRVWVLGGNYVTRPVRRAAFVHGDISTRLYPVGLGHLNLFLKRPIYYAPSAGWEALLRLGPGDVAARLEPIDHRAWPLRRSQEAGVVSQLARADFVRRGEALVQLGGARLAVRLEDRTLSVGPLPSAGSWVVFVDGDPHPLKPPRPRWLDLAERPQRVIVFGVAQEPVLEGPKD